MTTSSDPRAPSGDSGGDEPDGRHGKLGTHRVPAGTKGIQSLVALPVLAIAAGAGWALAGPPPDAAAVVPPACPAVLTAVAGGRGPAGSRVGPAGDGAAPRAGAPDVLVPMPLPQPRGPVSARVCGYRRDGDRYVVGGEQVLDPTRTAALAGLLNASPGGTGAVVTPPVPPGGCAPGDAPAVLVFRYTEGGPAFVEVVGGPCEIVATSTRLERGRGDVVRSVAGVLADGGHGTG